ncbi:hypothetical protein GWI72_06415 [Microvirga tunisiensis]|uniref:Uncharacterized protein n=1 Tax=Pannonibacter tanglangensis TaxID=2750084 RepID=A0A7X5F178_9HYPH|nr:hypothetical protein [Pannonibacter sp. XCT-53]NBN77900.1 hypothetical protein [Pannonibacter sp. XCT-53]
MRAEDPLAPEATRKPCICRAQGLDHEVGSTVCLRSAKGPRLARCVMVLNNTSWKFSDMPCALAMAPAQPGPRPGTGLAAGSGTVSAVSASGAAASGISPAEASGGGRGAAAPERLAGLP